MTKTTRDAHPSREDVEPVGLPANFYSDLGGRIRRLRDGQTLSLEQLSELSGVSRAMLSKVERGEKSPTIGVLTRIAHALGSSLSALIGSEEERRSVVVIPREQRLVFRDAETGFERHLLSPPVAGSAVELLFHHLPAEASTGTLPPYPVGTEKHVVVTEGELRLVTGEQVHTLQSGDAAFFQAEVPHSFENRSGHPCGYYLVISRRERPA